MKGGKNSNGKHGFIFSNANWDPYPLSNDLEAFTIAIANMDIAIMLRAERFGSEFFTGEGSQNTLKSLGGGRSIGGDFGNHETWQHIQAQIMPVPPGRLWRQFGRRGAGGAVAAQIDAGTDRGRRHVPAAGGRPAHRHALAGRAQGAGRERANSARPRPRPGRRFAR